MKRPLILAAVVALAISLLALGLGLRDTAPSTHAQGAATATATATTATTTATATATTATVTATTAPTATATTAPTATATATASPTTTTSTTTATCTATTLGVARTANEALAEDCDTLLALRDKLPRPTAQNWLNWSPALALTSWTGVRVSGTPKRVTALRLTGANAPYAFRAALADLANPDALDALVDLHLAVYKTPPTTKTTETTLPATLPTCGTQANKALKKDCDTLLAIESTLAGTATLNWGDSTAAFTSTNADGKVTSGWDGILVGMVKGKVRVTGLDLPDKSLTGVIPTQIEDLTALTKLDLARNNLSGAIPTQIGKLTALTHLDLQNNRLSGAIPTQIGKLVNLTDLYLDRSEGQNNNFTGTIPTQLGDMKSLKVLKLQNPPSGLIGGIPPQLGKLSNLEKLDIRHSGRLGGSIPPQLGNLANLRNLTLIGLGLTGTIPPELGNLKLGVLRLKGGSQLTGPIHVPVAGLTYLDLERTGVCIPAGVTLPTTLRVLRPTPAPRCPTGN